MRAENSTRIPDGLALSRSEPMIELLKGGDNRAPLARLGVDHTQFGSIKPCGTGGSMQRRGE
jgi:hypothetical protein